MQAPLTVPQHLSGVVNDFTFYSDKAGKECQFDGVALNQEGKYFD